MSLNNTYKRIYETVMQAHKVLVVAHPECGDALGSTLAITHWLDSIDKDYVAYSNKPVPLFLDFLPKSFVVQSDPDSFHMADFDVVLILDSNYHMTGISKKLEAEIDKYGTIVINIDHHITNTQGEGDISAIETTASSTTRMLYDFFVTNNIFISRDVATCLLVGILFDTGNFSNNATDHKALSTSSVLLAHGAPISMIIEALVNDKTINLLRFWGKVLSRLTHEGNSGIVYTVILEDDIEEEGLDAGTGKLANFLNNIDEGKFIMILREDKEAGLVKCSLRTTQDGVNVSQFAGFFGGGGHIRASGFAIPGRLVYNERTGKHCIQ